MAITATFPQGMTHQTVHGLHQWDYGRRLVIRDHSLPALVEVHFGYPGAREAVVRSCSAANGVASVSIPDTCLEQPACVTAWVYEAGETSGRTIRTVVLPIIARPRPAALPSAPPENVSNKYTEAVSAMNKVVEDAKNGDILVNYAGAVKYTGWTSALNTLTRIHSAGVYIIKFTWGSGQTYIGLVSMGAAGSNLINVGPYKYEAGGIQFNRQVTGKLDAEGVLTLSFKDTVGNDGYSEVWPEYQYIPLVV